MDTIQNAQQQLTDFRKRIRILFVLYTLVCAVAVVLLFQAPAAGFPLCVVSVLFYITYLRRQVRRYSNGCTEAIVRFGVGGPLSDTTYVKKNLWDMDWMKEWRMLPVHGDDRSLLTRHGFRGQYRDLTVEGAETTIHYQAAGAKGKPTFLFLSGTMMAAHMPPGERGSWLVLREDLLSDDGRDGFLKDQGYQPADFGDTRLEGSYRLYTTRPDHPFPAELRKKLRPLLEQAGKLGALRLAPDGAAAFVDTRFYTQRIPVKTEPTAQLLSYNALAERDTLLEVFAAWSKL